LIAFSQNTFEEQLSSLDQLRVGFEGSHDDAAYDALVREVHDALTELIALVEEEGLAKPTRFDRDEPL